MKRLQAQLSVSIVQTAINALQAVLDRNHDWLELSQSEEVTISYAIDQLQKMIDKSKPV